MSYQRVIESLGKIAPKSVLLLCHHNADPDALCSAYAFKGLLKRLLPYANIEIGAAHGISRLSKHIQDTLAIEVQSPPEIEKADVIVLLDTNTIQQLNDLAGAIRRTRAPILVIDHHAPHPETRQLAELYIAEEEASSTSEIIYRFYTRARVIPSRTEAQALLLGIAFDTRHFKLASSSTLKAVAMLGEVIEDVQETLILLSLPMPPSERTARLKAAKRAKLETISGWIVALTHVNAYQASAARAMIELGAHVAIVAGQKNTKLDISLRSNREFSEKTKIHLGKDIARPVGHCLEGMGGGHSTAAGINGFGDVEAGLDHCLRILREKLTST